MAQYAMIQDNVVTNVCEWDGVTPFNPGDDITLTPISDLPDGVWIGWTRDHAGAWSQPPVTEIVT